MAASSRDYLAQGRIPAIQRIALVAQILITVIDAADGRSDEVRDDALGNFIRHADPLARHHCPACSAQVVRTRSGDTEVQATPAHRPRQPFRIEALLAPAPRKGDWLA